MGKKVQGKESLGALSCAPVVVQSRHMIRPRHKSNHEKRLLLRDIMPGSEDAVLVVDQ